MLFVPRNGTFLGAGQIVFTFNAIQSRAGAYEALGDLGGVASDSSYDRTDRWSSSNGLMCGAEGTQQIYRQSKTNGIE